MAKVSVNSSQNKCCHLKCGNQACKGKERNVTCNPSDSVNKLGSCFRFLSDKATYPTVWKVTSSCWNSGKSTRGFFCRPATFVYTFSWIIISVPEAESFHLSRTRTRTAQLCTAEQARNEPVTSVLQERVFPCVWTHTQRLHCFQGVCTRMHNSRGKNRIAHQAPSQRIPGQTPGLGHSLAAQMEPPRSDRV